MRKTIRETIFALILIAICVEAKAIITIEIDHGIKAGVPIAVVPFGFDEPLDLDFKIDQVIRNDLSRTGRFAPLHPENYLSHPTKKEDVNFDDWRLIDVDYLVIGYVESTGEENYEVVFRLYNPFEMSQVFGIKYNTNKSGLRKTAHLIANTIYEQIIGVKSSFDSQVAYIVSKKVAEQKFEHYLYVSDYDGYNPQEIFKSDVPILSPAWSPDSSRIAYSVLYKDKARIFIHTLATGDRSVIADFEGQNRSPSWSWDGRYLAFSNSKQGNSDVYIIELQQNEVIRLTNNRQIDTEPAWSPDGKSIVFTSNRGKNPQIYRVQLESGAGVERLTVEGKYNAGAKFSPSGEELLLITNQGNGNQVAIFDLKSGTTKIVSSTFLDDSASFSPNGDMLIYIVEGSDRHVKILSPDGIVQSRMNAFGNDVKQIVWESRK